jgi:hypothetical protein
MEEPKGIISIQNVRLLDVFVVAPFLFYVASEKSLNKNVRLGLYALAAGTLIYNGYNYMRVKKRMITDKDGK